MKSTREGTSGSTVIAGNFADPGVTGGDGKVSGAIWITSTVFEAM